MTTALGLNPAPALETLLQSPQLPDHIAELQAFLEAEQRRRGQFIEEMAESTKAEFINGEIIIHSPARMTHLEVSLDTAILLRKYVNLHGLGKVFHEKCLIRCRRNDYEPDIVFFQSAKTQGWDGTLKIFPPPDLIVEVLSPSTERNDRTVKFQDYAAHGVSEYWIIDADARVVEQYALPSGASAYTLHARVEADGRLVSPTISGFDVPAAALFDARENQRVLAAMLQGV